MSLLKTAMRSGQLIKLFHQNQGLPSSLPRHSLRRFSTQVRGPSHQNPAETFLRIPSTGCLNDSQGKTCLNEDFGPSICGTRVTRSAVVKVHNCLSLPFAVRFRSFIHSGSAKEDEMERSPRPMDFVRRIVKDNVTSNVPSSQFYGNTNMVQNADIVHIKMLRNNTFVTITDCKGNRKSGQKVSASAGSLPDKGGKNSRYGAEAAAEHVGRKARDSGIRSVVVKVNGFTYFKKKRQAILSFREGYTHSRGDQNPIVYIEDTTRRPHNGCRLPKKRRI